MNEDGSNKATIYDAGTTIHQKTWSPDGTKIAFRLGFKSELWVIDVSVVNGEPMGTNARFLRDYGGNPCWSPLGDEIAVTEQGTYLRIISPTDGSVIDTPYTTSNDKLAKFPAWNLDAEKIAFVESEPNNNCGLWTYDIMILDVDTRTLTTTVVQNWYLLDTTQLDWANDHNWLAFYGAKDTENVGLFILVLDTNEITCIADSSSYPPTFSHDDSKLIYSSGTLKGMVSQDLSTGDETKISRWGFWPDARPTDEPW
jgi:Tol biopolymer transport system component